MLAQDYCKQASKLPKHLYFQPKLDGVRLVVSKDDIGVVSATSGMVSVLMQTF